MFTMSETVVGYKENADVVNVTAPPSKENEIHVIKRTIMLILATS